MLIFRILTALLVASPCFAQDGTGRFKPISDLDAARGSEAYKLKGLRAARDEARAALAQAQRAEAAARQTKEEAALKIAREAIEIARAAASDAESKLAAAAKAFNERAKAARALCAAVPDQLARDRVAIERQGISNRATIAEIEKWSKANKDASMSLLTDVAKAAVGHYVRDVKPLQEKVDKLRAAAKEIASQKQNAKAATRIAKLGARLEKHSKELAVSEPVLNRKLAGKYAKDGFELFALFKDQFSAEVRVRAKTNEELRKILEDPDYAELAGDEFKSPSLEGLGSLVGNALEEAIEQGWVLHKYASLAAPTVRWSQFVVDFTFHSTEWYLTMRRTQQFAGLGEENARAARALQKQQEVTYKAQQACHRLGFLK